MNSNSVRGANARALWAIPAFMVGLLTSTSALAASLSLADALARAASADPSTAAASSRVSAAEALTRQAGLRPNPVIDVALENFSGTGPYSLLDRAEATVTYEQTWERGGKREARIGRARAEIEVARLRGEVRRLDYLRDTQIAYAEAMAAEAALLMAEARYNSALASQSDIDRRVKSARDPLFAGSRAETLTAQALIARDQARHTAKTSRLALAAYWAGGDDFTLELEPFFTVTSPQPAHADLRMADLALLSAERDVALAAIKVEQSRTVTDPTVRAGVRYLGEGSGVALVVGGSIPLQRFDRNRGNIERALAERNAAEMDIIAARMARDREIARLVNRMTASAQESERIRAEVIPAASRTVTLVTDGFNRGGFLFSDVTSAHGALADARARRVTVLSQYQIDQAALDRLTGRHAAPPPVYSKVESR